MFENFNLLPGTQIMAGRLPDEIFSEITTFVEHCRKIKDHPLGSLYNHLNKGKNSYQISIPKPLLEQSFLFPYLIKVGELYMKKQNYPVNDHFRQVRLRSVDHHFDGYDCWVNFTKKGDYNPPHDHPSTLAGVIYYSNKDKYPTIFQDNTEYTGDTQEIIIFPAKLMHFVPTHTSDDERITLSFNLDYIEV